MPESLHDEVSKLDMNWDVLAGCRTSHFQCPFSWLNRDALWIFINLFKKKNNNKTAILKHVDTFVLLNVIDM